MFCGCKNAFGGEPNTQVCPVCLGQPGSLPVLNKKAFEYAIKVAFALSCNVQKTVKFDRKNYYYPDLPKNYQISQFDMPIAYEGKVKIFDKDGAERIIGVTRAHLEEDAGKLIHDAANPFSYVDLNRTGTPLLEIVSEPEIKSPDEAYRYLTTLKQIIEYLGVSDCNMEEGSLRCDANISLREKGAKGLGVKVEIKNLNSFKAVRDALSYEEERQEDCLEEDDEIIQETRLWDENKGVTLSMRTKEGAHDYRYFPDPDLVPFEVNKELVDRIKDSMPELPEVKAKRFTEIYKLDVKDVEVLISERELADFFEEVVSAYDDPQAVCNWVKGEVLMHVKESSTDIKSLGLKALDLAEIIKMAKDASISGLAAKDVLKINIKTGKAPADIVKEKGLQQVSDEGELAQIIDHVVENNEKTVSDYKNGKGNALSFLVGQVMKESKGKANPNIVNEMLRKKLG